MINDRYIVYTLKNNVENVNYFDYIFNKKLRKAHLQSFLMVSSVLQADRIL